jgi:hypothetical protein
VNVVVDKLKFRKQTVIVKTVQLSKTKNIPLYHTDYSALFDIMPPISLLGVVDELMNQLPTLLEQVLKTEIENRAVTSQCIDMEKQIQELEREVVQEQTKQKKLKERLVTVQSQTRRRAECSE